jgi:hypothetical protein
MGQGLAIIRSLALLTEWPLVEALEWSGMELSHRG